MILINLATFLALYYKSDIIIPISLMTIFMNSAIVLTIIEIAIYYFLGLYRSLWKYASIGELIQIFFGTMAGTIAAIVFGLATNMMYPRSVYVFTWMLTFLFLSINRISYRLLKKAKDLISGKNFNNNNNNKRVMIVGAGDAGSMLIKEFYSHKDLMSDPIAVIDDDKWKHKSNINGVPIVGNRTQIVHMAKKYKIDEIIVAIPSVSKTELSEILKICKETKCKMKTLPGLFEIINGRISIKSIRDVSIADLLGRDEVKLNIEEIAEYLNNEVVLVTGGGGSIGSELCRQIAKFNPKKLIIFDIYENNAYDLQNELLHLHHGKLDLTVLIGSVRDKERLEEIFSIYRPSVVFHAAAHKHVPLMENNPDEAIKNNVFGTLNTAQCASDFGVKRFVFISSDKAVNPTNIMGASKRVCEMIIQSINLHSNTEFVAVRFGNVLGSSGSVIPLFEKQIRRGGPITVTHPDIIRYFMTIPEAARLVIQAGAIAKGGEIFILDMGEPVKIVDLARGLIKLSGLVPDVDIKIKFSGLRKGEKLYEELLMAEEDIQKSAHDKIYIGKPLKLKFMEVLLYVKALENSLGDANALRECMSRVVPTYNYESIKSDRWTEGQGEREKRSTPYLSSPHLEGKEK